MMATLERTRPSTDAERIEIADVLRGFAVCGILFVNILYFKAPGSIGTFGYEGTTLDRLVVAGVLVFAQGKFVTLFSFLFGWGFAMQLLRAEERGRTAAFPRLFVRRLLALGLFGVAHAALLSDGDILLLYALTALLLAPMRGARPEGLIRWAIGIIAVSTVIVALLFGVFELGRAYSPEAMAQADTEFADGYRRTAQSVTAAYLNSSFVYEIAARVETYIRNAWVLLIMSPTVLAMFMLGFVVGRRGLLSGVADHQTLVRRVCAWALGIGMPLALLVAVGVNRLPVLSALWAFWFNGVAVGPIVAMGYCAGFALLWQRPTWQRRLRPLVSLGRLALTNYLLQSAIATFLFHGFGFGLARQVSPSLALLIATAILAMQLVISGWWLRRHRFGPVEWLWRALTYGHAPPMRRVASSHPRRIPLK